MTENQGSYEVDEYQLSQEELALIDEAAAIRWLTDFGMMENAELLNRHWSALNAIAVSRPERTMLDQRFRNQTALEMLRRTDNRKLSATALPPSVYQTWCKITRQEKPENWEVDCGNACGVQEPYGWVPEAGCPVHDVDLEASCPLCKVKVAPRMFCECCGETWAQHEHDGPQIDSVQTGTMDDSSGIEISGDMCPGTGDTCDWCSLVQCRSNPDHREWIGKNRMKSADTFGEGAFGIDAESARTIIDELRATEQHRIIEQKSECVKPGGLCRDCVAAESCKFKAFWRTKCSEYVAPDVPKNRAKYTSLEREAMYRETQELAQFGHARLHKAEPSRAQEMLDERRAAGGDDPILRPFIIGDFGIKAERVRDRIAELRRDEAEPIEHRCGIVLLLDKLAAVARAHAIHLDLNNQNGQSTFSLAHLAIKASAEIFENNECLGLDCDQCGQWGPDQ